MTAHTQSDQSVCHTTRNAFSNYVPLTEHDRNYVHDYSRRCLDRIMMDFSKGIWEWAMRLENINNRATVCGLVTLFIRSDMSYSNFMATIGIITEYIIDGYICRINFIDYVFDQVLQRPRIQFNIMVCHKDDELTSSEMDNVETGAMEISQNEHECSCEKGRPTDAKES